MPNIHHELIIGASPTKVYNAITGTEGLSAWWTPGAKAEANAGSIARFGFGDGYFKEMEITDLETDRLVKWTCTKGTEEWVGTHLSFELEGADKQTFAVSHPELKDQLAQQNDDEGTLLIFHHNDWKAYTPMFAECSFTWGRFLWSLKLYCETGKGLPWPTQHRTNL